MSKKQPPMLKITKRRLFFLGKKFDQWCNCSDQKIRLILVEFFGHFGRRFSASVSLMILNSPACYHRDLSPHPSERSRQGGSKFRICCNKKNEPCMVWIRQKLKNNYLHFPQDVLKHCCDKFLPQNPPPQHQSLVLPT